MFFPVRLLYLTDTHVRCGTPQYRKDEFFTSMHTKFIEVIHLCRRLKVDFVIHGGDLFDVPSPDARSFELMLWLLKELDRPVYCVAGNHDLFEQRLDSLEQTALGYLARSRLVKLLQPGEKVYLSNGNCVIQLSGQHYHTEIDRVPDGAGYLIEKKRCDVAVHVVHGMLLPRAFSEKVPTTLIAGITGTGADFTLCGHAHLGYHESYTGKHFINPGAMARLTNLEKELTRTPQVVYLDFTSDASYRFIQLKSARPGIEVMDLKTP